MGPDKTVTSPPPSHVRLLSQCAPHPHHQGDLATGDKNIPSTTQIRCTFCATTAIGDERHCVFDCPHFQGLRQQHAGIFRDSHDAMMSVMWHKDQKSVCALVLAIVNEAQTL